MSSRTNRRGQSLVELVFAMAIFAIVIGLPAKMLDTSSRAYSTGSTTGEADLEARRALDAIGRCFEQSGLTGIPAVGAGANVPLSGVTFRRVTGYAGGLPIWGADERIEMQPEPGEATDGADDDGDGLIDEQRVVWIEDLGLGTQAIHVLCDRVRRTQQGEVAGNGVDDNGDGLVDEGGLAITFDGERTIVRLALERRDAHGTLIDHSANRTIALRN